MVDARLELRIGAPVLASNGLLGHVHRVILRPGQGRVAGLVVRAGRLPRRDWIVPVDLIADVTDERVVLRASRDDLLRQQSSSPVQDLARLADEQGYRMGAALASMRDRADEGPPAAARREQPRIAQRGTLEGHAVLLRPGQRVWATDGPAGRVDMLLLDASGRVRAFVIRQGRLTGDEVIVPLEWIRAIDEGGVRLASKRAALEQLPPYAPDDAIAADVDRALWTDWMISSLDSGHIEAAVQDGVVILRGHTTTPRNKRRAERAVQDVPGVLQLKNRIVSDDEVLTAVAQALARALRTPMESIFVHAQHGIVTLSGKSDSFEVRSAAEEVAASVPQVRAVINNIRAPGVVVDPERQRVLQPRIGQKVYAQDGLLGRVERVIISLYNRRVTAFVLRGRLSGPEGAEAAALRGNEPRQEHWAAIPIEVVRAVTAGEVLLKILGADLIQFPPFDSTEYVVPDQDWTPPYPYTHADVLLDLDWISSLSADYLAAPAEEAVAAGPGSGGQLSGRERHAMHLSIGAAIRCRDGAAGRLKYVVIDPEDGQVTNLIVERGMLLRRDVVVPAAWVERASAEEIMLNTTIEDLNALPEYTEIDFIEPDPSYRPLSGHRIEEMRIWVGPYQSVIGGKPWIQRHVRLGIQDDEVLLQRGLPVLARDRRTVGALDHLVVEPVNHRVTHLVVRRGWLWNRQARIVPAERVAAVTEYGVRLDMTEEEIDQAPPYQAPASDAQIAASLQRALETDPRTRAAGLRVVVVRDGVVRFVGAMTDAVKDAARAIAPRILGVIGFADDIQAPPSPPLRIGAPVYARDGRYGTLHKVVVDPHARRVTHLILRQGWLLAEDRVLPIERVAAAEEDGVYLDGVSAELDQYPPYREETFVEPLVDWEALESYSPGDTLFWGGPYTGIAPPILPVVEFTVPSGVPEDEVVLRRGADIIYNGELVGLLDHVLIDPTSGSMTHLVVEQYERGGRVIVPAGSIREIHGEAIVLDQWDPDRPGVPVYEAAPDDAEIHADLSARLLANKLGSVRVDVDSGVARLSGSVPTMGDKAAAESMARSTPGVMDVSNALEVRPEP